MRAIASPRRATVPIEEPAAEKQVTPPQAKSKSIVGKTLLVTVVMITGAFLVLAVAELAYKIALFVKEKSLGKKCKVDAETHDFFKPLLAQLEVCTQWQASEVHQRFSMATDDERKVLLYLKNHYEISDQTMKQIYYGAHVTLEDKGESYKYFGNKLIKKESVNLLIHRVMNSLLFEANLLVSCFLEPRWMEIRVFRWKKPLSLSALS